MRNVLLLTVAVLLVFTACRRDEQISTDASHVLEFSRDTMIFDTVFTTVGTATQTLKVYNREPQAVEVSTIRLGEGDASSYRMNVDGIPGSSFQDVIIPGNDSIFIFIEVTIDPNMVNAPLIETDSILFSTNGNEQHVDLVAWGQDACFFYPNEQVPGLPPTSCLDGDCNDVAETFTWTNDKPIVIYGYLVVFDNDHLIIEEGTQIHFHNGSGLWVWENGRFTVNGSVESPVVFQHDRPEELYDDIPGQWDLIRISEGTEDNVISNAIIKNSIIGIEAKPLTLAEEDISKPTSSNTLLLENVIIKDQTAFGLLTRKYRIDATNCLFANAGQNVAGLSGGGLYDFRHCTFGNYWTFGTRVEPAFYMSDLYRDELGLANQSPILGFSAENCIFYGNTFSEFIVEPGPSQDLSVIEFDHCLVRIDSDDMDISDTDIYSNMLSGSSVSPAFVAPSDGDFHLGSSSDAIDAGVVIGVDQDIEGVTRTGQPDLGCYEFVD